MEYPKDLRPTTAACVRGNIRQGLTFDAEIVFNGQHYVVQTGLKERDDAKKIAQLKADELTQMIIQLGDDFIKKHGWPKAKE